MANELFAGMVQAANPGCGSIAVAFSFALRPAFVSRRKRDDNEKADQTAAFSRCICCCYDLNDSRIVRGNKERQSDGEVYLRKS